MPAARLALKCSVCGRKDAGACIQCETAKCTVAFHPLCMLDDGSVLKTARKTKSGFKLAAYCPAHADAARAVVVDDDSDADALLTGSCINGSSNSCDGRVDASGGAVGAAPSAEPQVGRSQTHWKKLSE